MALGGMMLVEVRPWGGLMRRRGWTVLVLTLSASTLLPMAHAADEPSVGIGGDIATNVTGLHSLASTISFNAIGTGVLPVSVLFDCKAMALPTAASTGIDRCFLQTQTRVCSPSCSAWVASQTYDAVNVPNNFPGPPPLPVGSS